MGFLSPATKVLRLALVVVFLIGSFALVSADKEPFTAADKAFYADPNLINFVRPGLVFKILSAEVGQDGTIKARFKITDPKGLPLDRDGVTTPGAVSTSLIAAYIPKGKTQYVAYTTRTQGPSPITGKTAIQAGADSGGTYEKVADGEYIYTFKTKAPAGYDRTATHTIGLYGNRNLSEFELGVNLADTTFNFVPDGSKVVDVRDVVKTATCNKCHQDLAAHGETGRKSMEVCVLCHTPQTVDPDTGRSVDMVEMTHKIHMGAALPSVKAGTPYVIIGNRQSVNDYSHVVFPADTRNCVHCHEAPATQAENYLKPNRVACGSCHDNVNFATGENHVDLPQVSDNQCATCHIPEGEIEFDASIKGAHMRPTFSSYLPGTVFGIIKVDDGMAGKKPTVTFSIKDKKGNPILPSEMTRLSLILTGPNSDYPGGYVRDDARKATGSGGTYTWTFSAGIPADAKGSYTVAIEGYRNIVLLPGTKKEQTARDAGLNTQKYFSVDGSPVEARRTVVSTANCNKCHAFLSFHGGNRNTVEQCGICHNPNATAASGKPEDKLPNVSIDFRLMIHKIHTGEELGGDYLIGDTNFNEVLYPGDRRNCAACHVNNSQQLPLGSKLLPVNDPSGLLSPMGPETAACTSCHTSVAAASHALVNTSRLGESCSACHGAGREFSVDRSHAR